MLHRSIDVAGTRPRAFFDRLRRASARRRPPIMPFSAPKILLAALLLALPGTATANPLAFADVASLTLAAPVIVRATITGAERISAENSPGLAPGQARLLVSAAVDAALIAPGTVPATLSWLWDTPLDTKGKPPKPKGNTVLAFLGTPSADGKTRLIAGAAQQPLTPELEAQVRAIATDARNGEAPAITGISNGFRADGTVPGESESQFFLATADGKGLTMVVTRKPGETLRVAVSRGDVIDESAASVKPQTLLWYRLACTLPAKLPVSAGGSDAALAADWTAALASLGPCGRALKP
jgi:hypothetical protein